MNFKEFDNLIHSGAKEIVLDSDVIFGGEGEFKYSNTIELDVDDLIIDGAGHVIDARCSQQIFEVTGSNIKIKNLTIEGGFSKLDGGAIHIDGGSLIIEDCTFMENHATGFESNGGAICNRAGSLDIFRTSFLRNSAAWGAAIHNEEGKLNMTGSIIADNYARSDGAAITNVGGDVALSGCEILENKSEILRTGFTDDSIIANDGFFEVQNCSFKDNHSSYLLINLDGADLRLCDVNFIGNHVRYSIVLNKSKSCRIINSIFEDNLSGKDACNILNKGDLTLRTPVIERNLKHLLNEDLVVLHKEPSGFTDGIENHGRIDVKRFSPDERFE